MVKNAEIDPQSTVLLCVDVQNGFISDYTKKALPRIHSLVRREDFAVKIASQFINGEGSSFRTLIRWDRLSPASFDIQIDPVVKSNVDLIFPKFTYGHAAEVLSVMRSRNVNDILLVGIDTDVCVLQNAGQLFDLGARVYVDLDGCASNGGPEADHAAGRLMERTIGRDQVFGTGRPLQLGKVAKSVERTA
ncbi:cysteine hydrolase [Corynebacterium cystitidis]|uniref:cysteine hydrolase n=1 Tax=Corynebacterium cystitidis TaxID=35757 RepID=UPI00211F46A5|nr:cysteine hydrolase [Corynebacterium cystitidis]